MGSDTRRKFFSLDVTRGVSQFILIGYESHTRKNRFPLPPADLALGVSLGSGTYPSFVNSGIALKCVLNVIEARGEGEYFSSLMGYHFVLMGYKRCVSFGRLNLCCQIFKRNAVYVTRLLNMNFQSILALRIS